MINAYVPESINEQDEFDVEAPEGWDVQELGVGDYLDSSNLKMQNPYKKFKIIKTSKDNFGWNVVLDIYNLVEEPVLGTYGQKSTKKWVKTKQTYVSISSLEKQLKPGFGIDVYDNGFHQLDESEFDVDSPEGWNVKELTAGDTIKSNWVKPSYYEKHTYKGYVEPGDDLKILQFSRIGGQIYVLIQFPYHPGVKVWEELNWFNSEALKPDYQVVVDELSSFIRENEDDEWTVDTPEGWNVKELGVGDRITPDMLKNPDRDDYKLNHFLYHPEYRVEIQKIDTDQFGEYVILYITIPGGSVREKRDLDALNSLLKPDYQIVSPTNLKEGEFDVEAPKDWEKEFLTVGDKITPDMWDDVHGFKFREPVYIIDIGTDDGGDFVLLNNKPHSDFYDTTWDLDEINWNLKHPYTIVNDINESESEDFNVEAPKDWEKEYLTIGDKITPDMWANPDLTGELDWNGIPFRTYYIIDFGEDEDGLYVALNHKQHNDGYDQKWDLDIVNDNLKHPYIVINNLKEGEFDVDAPEEWNKILLTKGDYITPDMWKEIPKKFSNPPQSVEIGGFGLAGDDYDIEEVRLIRSDMSHVAYSFQLDDLNNELLKPEYQIVHLVGGNNKWKDLYEENESDDEFNVVAPKEWDSFPIIIEVTNYYNFWQEDDDYQDEVTETKVLETTSEELEQIIGVSIPHNARAIEELIGRNWSQYNDLLDLIYERGKVTEPIPDVFYGEGWDSEWEDISFYVTLPDKINEQDEFSVVAPEDWDQEEWTGNFETDEDYDSFTEWITRILKKHGFKEKKIDLYLDDLFHYGDIDLYQHVMEKDLVNDFEKYWQNEDELNELDDEFSVDAPEDWNEFSLSEGDDITLDMVEPGSSLEQLILRSTDKKVHIRRFYDDLVVFEVNLPPNKFIKEPYTDIIKMGWEYLEGKQLKPNYKFRPNGLPHNFDTLNELLSEKEDEFDVTAPEDWNVTELTVGDKLTPDMFSDGDFPNWKWEGSDFFIQMFGNDGHKDYIRISYETKWGIRTSALMYIDKVNELVLKPEYKVVKPNNLNELLSEDEDEWDVTAPEEWSKIELGVGSIITLDMFKDVEEAKKEFQGFKKLKITRISTTTPFTVDLQPVFWWRRINFNRLLRSINKELKDEYMIVNTLKESDEFNVDAPENWNVQELEVGDTITPDMWKGSEPFNFDFDLYIEEIYYDDFDDPEYGGNEMDRDENNYVVKVTFDNSEPKYFYGAKYSSNFFNIEMGSLNNALKPQYRIFPPNNLSENEDEFTVDAPAEWNEIILTVGDKVTPDMWDTQVVINAGEEDEFLNDETWDINDLTRINIEMESDGGGFIDGPIDYIQSLLKPQYRIVKPLNEEENEFSVKAPDNWNVIELTVGDTITPDMWEEINDHVKWQNNPIVITRFIDAGTYNDDDPDYVVFKMPESYEIIDDVDYINGLLKPEYLIVKSLNESEDEFKVIAPKEWNQKEITTGDTFKIKDTIYQIGEFDPDGRHVGVKRKKDNKYLTFPISLVQNKLPKNTILVKSSKKLSELLETDDEFDVDAPKEWNEIYLTIGDKITPEMWNRQAIIDAGDYEFLNNKTWTINDFVSRWIYMTSDIGYSADWDVKNVQSLLKPQYRIINTINELEKEDEFSVDAPKEWGLTQLTKGDTITPDMWKNIDKSLTNWFKKHGAESPTDVLIKEIRCWDREDKDCMVRIVLKNKPFSLKNIIKKSYYDSFGSPTYNSGWFDWDEWMNINELNDLLKPQYKIVSPENLHESDDEFNVVAPREWSVDPNTPVYIKRYRVLKAIDNNDQEGYVEETLETTYTIEELETVFRKNYPYDNISEELLTKWIYDNPFYYLDWDSTEVNIDFESSDDGFDVDNVSTWDTEDDVIEVSLN